MTKRAKRRNPADVHLRTEAAIKKAVQHYVGGDGFIVVDKVCFDLGIYDTEGKCLAIADLRDLYRKRAPLKGVMRKVRKAIQPKRRGAGK